MSITAPPSPFLCSQAEFGFVTWQSFSNRLVGFAAHKHYWDPVRLQWSYSSDWSNEYSIVLTGALFYHRQVTAQHFIEICSISDHFSRYTVIDDLNRSHHCSMCTALPH